MEQESVSSQIQNSERWTRRYFLGSVATAVAGGVVAPYVVRGLEVEPPKPISISSNSYPWQTFYKRAGKQWMDDPETCMRDFVTAGLQGYEPGVTSVKEIEALGPLLKKYNIAMKSVYVGTTLHDATTAEQNIDSTFKIARAAKAVGTKIIVTNPSPIRWGGSEDKDDAALRIQAGSLEKLGSLLAAQDMVLAYHNHDIELRQGAREFHHMLASTNPQFVSFCLDAHWIYRGMGNSQLALFDVVKTYGKRIVELHIRQSVNHVWSEVFGKGDIDYAKLVTELVRLQSRPNLVLEQCVEEGSPDTTDAAGAHREGLKYAANVFAPLAG